MKRITLPNSSLIEASERKIGEDCQIGEDVMIQCEELEVGDHAKIGVRTEDNFRSVAGVRIRARKVIFGDGVVIDRSVLIKGGNILFGAATRLGAHVSIDVHGHLVLGNRCIVREHAELNGIDIRIGHEFWMGPYARIGGGSCFEVQSRFRAGHFVHLGANSFINTARSVTIGNEVGLGSGTALYTHGAYPSMLEGKPVAFAPVEIGDRVWCPGAIINPGVSIGHDAVIGVGAVVTRSIPEGALAVGVPAKVVGERAFPRQLQQIERQKLMSSFLSAFADVCSDKLAVRFRENNREPVIELDDTIRIAYKDTLDQTWLESFLKSELDRIILISYHCQADVKGDSRLLVVDLEQKRLMGYSDELSNRLCNQLRRYGIRFYYTSINGQYRPW